jgi:hypothetical protein
MAWTPVVGSFTAGDSADRDIDELPETERRVLHEGAFSADEENLVTSWSRRSPPCTSAMGVP